MCSRKPSYELRLLPNLLSSLMAYYSGYSSIHSSDCSDYSGYLSNPGLDSDSDSDSSTCSGRYDLHTTPVLVILPYFICVVT